MATELCGTILHGRTFEPIEGRLVIEDGAITTIQEATVESDDIILPAFTNAHTHLGDSIAKEAGEGLSLEELVAPPDGLKHRLLRQATPSELVAGMRQSLRYMLRGGTTLCLDFREGGVEGVKQLYDAASNLDIEALAMARSSTEAMEHGDGFGASGANDADFQTERGATRRAGKPFGIHAGEVDSSDVDPALDLDPDFIVHAVHLTEDQYRRLEQTKTPVVICPRSNLATGVGLPEVDRLRETTTIALGTDNVMTNSPSMYREMAMAAKLFNLPSAEVLAMATYRGAQLAGRSHGIIEEGRPGHVQVLDGASDNLAGLQNPVRGVVRRAERADIKQIVIPDNN